MSRSYIGPALRRQIDADARNRCGYCLTSARITGTSMEIDHIIPESLAGTTVRENLWLACSMCNDCKSNRIAAPQSRHGRSRAALRSPATKLARPLWLERRGRPDSRHNAGRTRDSGRIAHESRGACRGAVGVGASPVGIRPRIELAKVRPVGRTAGDERGKVVEGSPSHLSSLSLRCGKRIGGILFVRFRTGPCRRAHTDIC